MLKKLTDIGRADSWANRARRKRFELFRSLIASVPRPLTILDVGGIQVFWKMMEMCDEDGVEIWLFNLTEEPVLYRNLKSVVGDARDMRPFGENEFDVVFSNSTIEHLGDWESQRQMADEVRRVGKRYFVQTPNRYFPIEPHYLLPFFQFLPRWAQVWLVTRFRSGWVGVNELDSIRLLSKRELRALFPGGTIFEEKFWGLNKSFIVYDGWENSR